MEETFSLITGWAGLMCAAPWHCLHSGRNTQRGVGGGYRRRRIHTVLWLHFMHLCNLCAQSVRRGLRVELCCKEMHYGATAESKCKYSIYKKNFGAEGAQ